MAHRTLEGTYQTDLVFEGCTLVCVKLQIMYSGFLLEAVLISMATHLILCLLHELTSCGELCNPGDTVFTSQARFKRGNSRIDIIAGRAQREALKKSQRDIGSCWYTEKLAAYHARQLQPYFV